MEKCRYEEMLPHEIIERRERFPAAFVPLGGLEWHGEHLAVGNDALKAQKLCELAAQASGGFAMPPVWYGEPRTVKFMEANHNDGNGITDKMRLPAANFTTRHFGIADAAQVKFYQQLIYHVLVQMNTLGMRAVCLVCGHYPLEAWALAAVKKFQKVKRFASTRVFAAVEPRYNQPEDWDKAGCDHAGHWETSYLWYLRPECVDLSVYAGRPASEPLVGLMGRDPRLATIALGRSGVKLIVKGMVAVAKKLLAEK